MTTTWPDAVMLSVTSTAGIALVAAAIWQAFKTWQTWYTARATLTRNQEFRRLAEEVTAAQDKTMQQLAPVVTELSEIRGRVAEMERMLKEVG